MLNDNNLSTLAPNLFPNLSQFALFALIFHSRNAHFSPTLLRILPICRPTLPICRSNLPHLSRFPSPFAAINLYILIMYSSLLLMGILPICLRKLPNMSQHLLPFDSMVTCVILLYISSLPPEILPICRNNLPFMSQHPSFLQQQALLLL